MNTKIFFTDLDGTLLTTEKTVSPNTYGLLRRWTYAGHRLVLNSGRALESILHTKESLNLNFPGMYLTGSNGGEIYDCTAEKLLLRRALDWRAVDKVFQLAEDHGIFCQTYTDTHIIVPRDCRELMYYRHTVHTPFIVTEDISGCLDKEPCKCLAIELTDLKRLEQFRQALLAALGDSVNVLYSNPNYLEIFPAGSGKGTAVRWLCRHLGIPLKNALAAGDEMNDLSMLQAAGISIAMANAREELKKAADIVTAYDNDHDGLCGALEGALG